MSDPKPKFERKPNRELFLSLSKDGRFLIVKSVESWILPRKYADVVLGSADSEATPKPNPAAPSEPKTKGS